MATNSESSWLTELFEFARVERWCAQSCCTTCGSFQFRCEILRRAARRAGIEIPRRTGTRPRDLRVAIPEDHYAAVYKEIVVGLRGLETHWIGSDAFRCVICETTSSLLGWGDASTLDVELRGTEAGAELSKMRAHAAELAHQQELRREYDSPPATDARKAERLKLRAERHMERLARASSREERRLELIAKLDALSSADRLTWLAARPQRFPLRSIPEHLIPSVEAAGQVSPAIASAVAALIDRRRGQWGRLARALGVRAGASEGPC